MKAPDELHETVQAEWAGNGAETVGQTASIPPLMRLASKVLLGVE